jgi:hypothetical protein
MTLLETCQLLGMDLLLLLLLGVAVLDKLEHVAQSAWHGVRKDP